MMRMLRDLSISALAALTLGLAARPAEGQAGSPVPGPASGEWDAYLSTSAPADETVAAHGSGANVWYWAGIGTATLGVGGAFSYYVKHDFFAHPHAATQGSHAPAGPAIREPGPVVTKPGQAGDTDPPPNPPKDGDGTVPDSSSTNPTEPPTDTQPGDDGFTEPPPPKTVPVPPPDDGGDTPVTVTPEPPTLVLLMSGVLAFFFVQRRRRRA
jgi:hypothetical protein